MAKHALDDEQRSDQPAKGPRTTHNGEQEKPLHGAQIQALSNDIFTVGWICALEIEEIAALEILDEEYDDFRPQTHLADPIVYSCGRIGEHKIVVVRVAEYGTISTAKCATHLCHAFPHIRFVLMVGVGGGVPSEAHDIRLGDVVVSKPVEQSPGVIQYDLGRQHRDGFERVGSLNKPPTCLMAADNWLSTAHKRGRGQFTKLLDGLLRKNDNTKQNFVVPKPDTDVLYKSDFSHVGAANTDCTQCEISPAKSVVQRKETRKHPLIHRGTIASGNTVVKDTSMRERIREQHNALCLEMEAAGLMNDLPCLVIRGISDYCDSHKNQSWQAYAAAAAAAYAKELLLRVDGHHIAREPTAKDLLEKFGEVFNVVNETNDGVTHLVKAKLSEKEDRMRGDLIQRLTPIDFIARRNDILSRRVKGTGTWLLQSSEFENFVRSPNSTLYCRGIQGAGKTMMASVVADHLINEHPGKENESEGVLVLSSYFDYKDDSNQTADKMIAAMLKQAIQRSHDINKPMEELHQKIKNGAYCTAVDLLSVLIPLLETFSQTFLVLDALDECRDQRNLGECLSLLQRLRTSRSDVRLFLTSRPSPLIQSAIQETIAYEEFFEFRAMDDDIYLFLEDQLGCLSNVIPRSGNLWKRVKQEIVESVDGMFLLAWLHVKSLKATTNEDEVEEALQNLCGSVPKAYENAVKRIHDQDPKQQQLAKRLIAWAVFSVRPLRSEELRHALTVELGDKDLNVKRLRNIEVILSVSDGLVSWDVKSDTIRLVHETAQEFFFNNPDFWEWNPQVYLTKTCLTYLEFALYNPENGFDNADQNPALDHYIGTRINCWTRFYCSSPEPIVFPADVFRQSPSEVKFRRRKIMLCFFHYAAMNWYRQAKSVQQECMPELVRTAMNRLVAGLSFNSKDGSDQDIIQPDALHTGMHYAVLWGLPALGEELRNNHSMSLDATDKQGRTPLSLAAEIGRTSMVKILASPKAMGLATLRGLTPTECTSGLTPLLCAASHNDGKFIEQLLQCGARVDDRSPLGETALHLAARYQNVQLVDHLLESGADVKAQGSGGSTALHLACSLRSPNLDIVAQLLLLGANANDKDNRCQTALHIATLRGNAELVAFLLVVHSSAAQTLDKDMRAELCLASASTPAKMLLREPPPRRLNLNAQDIHGITPLYAACLRGQVEMAEALLRCGADPNISDLFFQNCLHVACDSNPTELVSMLLMFGADVNALDRSGRRPKDVAIEHNNGNVIRILDQWPRIEGARCATREQDSFGVYSWIEHFVFDAERHTPCLETEMEHDEVQEEVAVGDIWTKESVQEGYLVGQGAVRRRTAAEILRARHARECQACPKLTQTTNT
ncbi:MAG: hypothetical protein M1821_009255 [Bathelium mastoideum]|nr:MAG: hypothetical protein M1821_009255 [Bathelium mastoideum]